MTEHAADNIESASTELLTPSRTAVLFGRLAIGFVVLICAELFSGATLKMGFWHPWTLVVTYWLYFAHFFLFTTLAVRTGRTSLASLYLWGVLFGMYESWITKVIWHGYGGDGHFAMGSIGPFGFSEISMVFFFHPVISFLLPLAVTCLLCPPLRAIFPDLAWLTQKGRRGRAARAFLFVSFAPIMAMNSGGGINLISNALFVVGCLLICLRLGRRAFQLSSGRELVVFSRKGLIGLSIYLGLLYVVTYLRLRPDGLPSVGVQLLTFAVYPVVIFGLWAHQARPIECEGSASVDADELPRVRKWFVLLLLCAWTLTPLAGMPYLFAPIVPVFVLWTVGGFVLTVVALVTGNRIGTQESAASGIVTES